MYKGHLKKKRDGELIEMDVAVKFAHFHADEKMRLVYFIRNNTKMFIGERTQFFVIAQKTAKKGHLFVFALF